MVVSMSGNNLLKSVVKILFILLFIFSIPAVGDGKMGVKPIHLIHAISDENQTVESSTSSATNYNESLLSPGWDVFSEPLSNGKVQWTVLDNGKLQVIFELIGASPNHRYIAGVHFFDPGGLGQMPAVCQFDGTKIECDRGPISRDDITATGLGAWDFGYLDTNEYGYGKAQYTLSPPPGTYYAQFTVRIGDQCNPSIGATGGCAVVYRTGTKIGQRFETIIIPSASYLAVKPADVKERLGHLVVQPTSSLVVQPNEVKEPIVETPETNQCDWTGTWDTEFGQMILQQSGDSISGSYSKNGVQGQIQGTVSESVLSGSWTGDNSEEGTFRFTMEDDCQFSGNWYSKDTSSQEDESSDSLASHAGKMGSPSEKVKGKKNKN
jgi:hypothetical protein